ncbi:MAG: hypothetical protein R2865_14620 [Deinococcales bacterium]
MVKKIACSIPELLHKEEPDVGDFEGDSLGFQYHYGILPSSIIARFIVKSHHLMSKTNLLAQRCRAGK